VEEDGEQKRGITKRLGERGTYGGAGCSCGGREGRRRKKQEGRKREEEELVQEQR